MEPSLETKNLASRPSQNFFSEAISEFMACIFGNKEKRLSSKRDAN
jgi:hypothetical protein